MKGQKTEHQKEMETFDVMAQDNEAAEARAVAEWNNGDECRFMNLQAVHRFIGVDPRRHGYCYIQAPCYSINFVETSKLTKPLTDREAFIEQGLKALDQSKHSAMSEALGKLFDAGCRVDTNLVEGK